MDTKQSNDKAVQPSPSIEGNEEHKDKATGQNRTEGNVKEVSIADLKKHHSEEWPSVSWP